MNGPARYIAAVAILWFSLVSTARAADTQPAPETLELFVAKCSSCHSVGQGDRVGPDLKGVVGRRDASWLRRMVQAPSSLLGSDPDARALLAKYNNVKMPDLGLSDDQTNALVELLDFCSVETCDLASKFTPVSKAEENDVILGRALFAGSTPLEKGGPGCIACHATEGAEAAIAGGTLSKDLTHAFSRLGDEGMDAALRNPAFAVMNKVFTDHPVTESEAFALRAYLDRVNRGTAPDTEAPPLSVPLAGVLLAIAALVLLNAAWSRRMRGVREPLVSGLSKKRGQRS